MVWSTTACHVLLVVGIIVIAVGGMGTVVVPIADEDGRRRWCHRRSDLSVAC
jgi:hypothetical protein